MISREGMYLLGGIAPLFGYLIGLSHGLLIAWSRKMKAEQEARSE